MKRTIPLIALIVVAACASGCAKWLGQYEPGVRFRLNPITKTLEFSNTTDTSVRWELLEAQLGEGNTLWIEGFEAEHSASAVAAQIGQQMAMSVESQRVGGQQILDGLAMGLNALGPAAASRIRRAPPTTQPVPDESRLDRLEALIETLIQLNRGP